MYKIREKKLGFEEVLLKKIEEMQMDMKPMTVQNEKINQENAKRLDAHKETLRDIVEQLKHLTRAIEQKSQETTTCDLKDIHEENEPCEVVTLWNGKHMGAQEDKRLLENKEVKDHCGVQGDGSQLAKSDVIEEEALIKEDFKENSLE